MKKTTLAAGLLAVAGVGLVGCKSTPKLAWWKSDKAADSTAVAHSAPALPSDLAKQSATTPTAVAQAGGGVAAPFVPGQIARTSAPSTAPAGYPSTDAPAFTPDVATRITSAPTASGTPAQSGSASTLGSIAASPYNPSATPWPTSQTATASTSPIPESRYGAMSATTPLYGQPATGAVASAAGTASASTPAGGTIPGLPGYDSASRYVSSPTGPTSPAAIDAANSYANRYNAAATGAVNTASTGYGQVSGAAANIAGSTSGGVQTATTAVATTAGQPYRPGGTGTYPASSVERVASVPQGSTSIPTTSGTSVPNVARPGVTTTTPTTTEAPRYR